MTGGAAPAGLDGVLADGDSVGADGDGRPLGTESGRADEGTPPRSRRRSRRSRRAAYPLGPDAAGSRIRAQISSSCMRGAVAPVISVRPALTMSAARVSAPGPNRDCWPRIRSSWSSGTPRSTDAAPSGTAATMMRSRRRSSRSSTNRRGSCPDSMTLSTWVKTAAPSPAASASMVASSSSPSVNPSSARGTLVGEPLVAGPGDELVEDRQRVTDRAAAGPGHEPQDARSHRDLLLAAEVLHVGRRDGPAGPAGTGSGGSATGWSR